MKAARQIAAASLGENAVGSDVTHGIISWSESQAKATRGGGTGIQVIIMGGRGLREVKVSLLLRH